PEWSPDGSTIVVSTIGGFALAHVAGSGVTTVERSTVEVFDPVWSPDGERIAFWAYASDEGAEIDTGADIYVVNADGSDLTQLPSTNISDMSPEWSPDGSQLLFHNEEESGE